MKREKNSNDSLFHLIQKEIKRWHFPSDAFLPDYLLRKIRDRAKLSISAKNVV